MSEKYFVKNISAGLAKINRKDQPTKPGEVAECAKEFYDLCKDSVAWQQVPQPAPTKEAESTKKAK